MSATVFASGFGSFGWYYGKIREVNTSDQKDGKLTPRENLFLTGSAIYLFSNILNAAIPFALLPILTRYLSPAEYGQVGMFQALIGALTAFIGLSMAGAAGRRYYDDQSSSEMLGDFIGACFQILLVTSTLALLVIWFSRAPLSQWLGLETKWLLLAVLVTAAQVVNHLRLGQWQVRKQAKQYGALQVGNGVANLLLSLLLVVVWHQGAAGRMSAQGWAAGLLALLAFWLLKRDGLLHLQVWRPAYVREALRFGVPLIPHVGGAFLLSGVDRFLINSELGLAEVGVYMVAVQFAAALGLVFDAINKAYVPWLFERLKRNRLDEKQQIVRLTYSWYLVILAAAGGAFWLGPWIVTFFAGESYSKAGEVIGWLALGQVFGGMYLMATNYIFYSKRTGLLSIATITAGFVNIGLLVLLIPVLGIRGAAIAFCIATALRFILTWWVAQVRHPMPWFNFRTSS